jgi:O-antigen ligase
MSCPGGPVTGRAAISVARTRSRAPALSLALIAIAVYIGFFFLYRKLRYEDLAAVLGAVLLVAVFTIVSFRWPQVPVVMWLLSLLGFRMFIYIPTPGLPDITLDRLMMLWASGVFVLKIIVERRRLPGPYLLDVLIALHGLYLLGNLLATHPQAMNLWTRSYLMAYTAYFLAKYLFTDLKWLRVIFLVLLLSNVYNGVTSIAEKMHWDFLVWPKVILDRSEGMQVPGRSRGIFLQSAVLGTVMGMLMMINCYYMRLARSVAARTAVYGAFAVVVLGLYFTYTRGNWVCAIGGLLTLTILGARAYARQTFRLVLVGAVLVGFGFLNLSQDRFLKERMGDEGTLTGRISTLSNAVRMFRDHPAFGVGFFNYMKRIPDYRGTVHVPFFGIVKQGEGDQASIHDIYLGSLAETGLVGFGLQIGIYAVVFRALLRRRRAANEDDEHFATFVFPVLVSMLVAYLLGGVSFDYRYFETINSVAFFATGLLYQYIGRTAIPDSGKEASPARRGRVQAYAVPR